MENNMTQMQIPALVTDDLWLEPYIDEISARIERYKAAVSKIRKEHKSLLNFACGHEYYGFNYDTKAKGWWYREWAPAAHQLFLIGDFNEWNRGSHPLIKNEEGVWEIFLPDSDYKKLLVHEGRIKVHVKAKNGSNDRIPAYIRRVIQDPQTHDFSGQLWNPKKKFEWTDASFKPGPAKKEPLIYEAHVGIAQEKESVGTYAEFTKKILPKIHQAGYNVIQLMAIMEHPYYGSFGYHVSNFFAPSSRFGIPEELKELINEAHQLGIAVIIDIVHSHAVKNMAEGLNELDGSEHQYFHPGPRGYHGAWDSKLFDYGKKEVLQFLLSNIRYWIEEFHIDGFRFDGITSMLYHHHGDFMTFDHYDKYFRYGVDWDALIYLQLANTVAHTTKKDTITVAEDFSGMPGTCREPEEGGLGFDFRLGMGIPDFWIKYLKEKKDEDWDIYEIWNVLSNRRYKEKTIAYAESHDQAIVGDKSIAFWLMDKEMYFHMLIGDHNVVIDRGIALHKIIRLLTASLGGEGYLNFIGNEFGHPEWVDFPREGNNWSYKHAKRQWSLADNERLKYKFMYRFDKEMISVLKENHILSSMPAKQLNMDMQNKVIIFERNNLIFIFNLHAHNSIFDYRFTAPEKGKYQIILNSDDSSVGGFDRIDTKIFYATFNENGHERLSIYLTNRTALVLKKV